MLAAGSIPAMDSLGDLGTKTFCVVIRSINLARCRFSFNRSIYPAGIIYPSITRLSRLLWGIKYRATVLTLRRRIFIPQKTKDGIALMFICDLPSTSCMVYIGIVN